jgi:hypothetical protein
MDVFDRVQKLIALAEHADTPPDEAQAARLKADKLMLDYKIEQDELDKHRPAADRMKPGSIEVPMVADWELIGYVNYLLGEVAKHTGCRVKSYSSYSDGAYNARVYGFEPDRRYFQMLYTTLRLHMVGALRPSVDPSLSIEENSYVLHSSGLNWFDIAKLHGWYGPVTPEPGEPKLVYVNRNTKERRSWAKAIAQYKIAYKRAVEERGEDAIHISPSGVKTFQINAADAYSRRIAQRLRQIRDRQPIGSALAMRESEVDSLFREENPELFKPAEPSNGKKGRAPAVRHIPFNQTAYNVGVKHADRANLNPSASPGNATKGIGNTPS